MSLTVRFVGSGDSFGSGGRFQTCIVVDGPRSRFAIDFGASSLIALSQQAVDHNSLDPTRPAPSPGPGASARRFPREWIGLEPGRAHPVLDLVVTPEPARHTRETS